uniref:Uncharacterized protein LOC113791270 n=1 Tax=Dermatophagoides pteronyssinus TaxID=6956 RepID=A0A6P6XVF0_DERPT|nr:uncharacterized protein LOC113791270 [Dermatophagoides pteronyssinus]
MAGLSVLVAWANELTEISVFQIKDFDPNWISGDNYPNHPIIYTTNDFIQAQGIIKFIGTSEEVKRIKEEIISKRTVSLESRDIQELKEMIFKMQKQLDEQSNKINQLEQKLDYLTQRPSADNNVITTGKNRMNVFINDLSAALIPNDEIKGLFRLCKTVLGDALIPGMTWREHSQEIRENITDLIYLFIDHKYPDNEEKRKLSLILKRKVIKKLNNQKKKHRIESNNYDALQ